MWFVAAVPGYTTDRGSGWATGVLNRPSHFVAAAATGLPYIAVLISTIRAAVAVGGALEPPPTSSPQVTG